MEEVGNILPQVLRRHMRGATAPVVQVLTPLWSRVAGKAVAAQCRPVAFAAGTLTLAASSASWARELTGLKDEICAAANLALGAHVVKQLRVRLAALSKDDPVEAAAPVALKPAATAGLSGASAADEGGFDAALRGLDPGVRKTLCDSFAKYFARRTERVN